MTIFFFKGLAFGFLLAATVGPMWVLCWGSLSPTHRRSWWIVLAAGAGWLRSRIGPPLFRAINIVAGLTILRFAVWQLAAVLG